MRPWRTGATLIGIYVLLVSASVEAATKSEQLYEKYERLNTAENLGKRFIGGKPHPFMEEQMKLLAELEKQPTARAARVVVRIAQEYLQRIEALGAVKFRRSPLQGLQIPLVSLMDRHAGSNLVFAQLERVVQSPLIKEYARGRALGTVAKRRLGQIRPADDPDGKKRAQLLLDLVIGDISISRLFHAPARLRQLVTHAETLSPNNPVAVRNALASAANSVSKSYATEHTFAAAIVKKQLRKKEALSEEEKKVLLTVCDQWLKTYRPLARKEKYVSDLLGQALMLLGGYKPNKELREFLSKSGLRPREYDTPPVAPPRRPGRPPRR